MTSNFLYVVIIATIVTKSQPQRSIGSGWRIPISNSNSGILEEILEEIKKVERNQPIPKLDPWRPNTPPPRQSIRPVSEHKFFCNKGNCDPLLNETIKGSTGILSNACYKDSRCLEFQYSQINGGGHLCLRSEIDKKYRNNTKDIDIDWNDDAVICRLILDDPCRDSETWCSYDPNCEHKEVQIKCSKHCKTCSTKCKDRKDWCRFEPKCDVEDVRTNCPKWCRVCVD